jgi:hypothetical protein
MSFTPNERYLFIAQPEGEQVRTISVADFSVVDFNVRLDEEDESEENGIPIAVSASADSEYLHVLWQKDANAILTRYAIDVESENFNLRREGLRGIWEATAHDMSISADERWAYVLQTVDEQGHVQAIDMTEIVRAGAGDADVNELLGNNEDIFGDLQFQRLVSLNRRLYVASNDDNLETQPQRGLVAVIDVLEDACADKFLEAVDGCPTCADDEDHCVIIAHVPNYRFGEPIVDSSIVDDTTDEDEEAPDERNLIDNFTHRQIVPSAAQIYEVIRCLLESGFAQGIPGPRGAAGEQGLPGEAGASVEMRVTETHIQWRQDDDDPTWTDLIALDELQGVPGDAGAGVEMRINEGNVLQWREIGTTTWIDLIDLDDLGGQVEPELGHIEAISWVHDNLIGEPLADFLPRLDPNFDGEDTQSLIIGFNVPIDPQSVLPERTDSFQFLNVLNQVVRVTMLVASDRSEVLEAVELLTRIDFGDYSMTTAPQNTYAAGNDVDVIDTASFSTEDDPRAIRIRLPNADDIVENLLGTSATLVIFRITVNCDFIREADSDRTIDGNHINVQQAGQPRNNRAGNVFESWFYGIVQDLIVDDE